MLWLCSFVNNYVYFKIYIYIYFFFFAERTAIGRIKSESIPVRRTGSRGNRTFIFIVCYGTTGEQSTTYFKMLEFKV